MMRIANVLLVKDGESLRSGFDSRRLTFLMFHEISKMAIKLTVFELRVLYDSTPSTIPTFRHSMVTIND